MTRHTRTAAMLLGSLALLAAAPSAAASARQTVVACDLGAYVIDPDPNGLNVRAGPGTGHRVIGKLPGGTSNSVEVEVTGASGQWLRIRNATVIDEAEPRFRGPGWVFARMLGTGTSDHGPVTLYRQPRRGSPAAGRLDTGTQVTLLGCRGGWAQVHVANLTGWLDPQSQCSATQTTCS
ncbi:MAG TPA: SH3 domain-containing protein [Longimicrobium sp.]|nr:SH3 domain-containing protein [Longimicrobium sp.]